MAEGAKGPSFGWIKISTRILCRCGLVKHGRLLLCGQDSSAVSLNIPFSEEQSISKFNLMAPRPMRTVGFENFSGRLVTSCGDGKRNSLHDTFERISRRSSVNFFTS